MSERETEKVESMEVDSLIWSEPEEASRQENSFQIYAVSKGLKNPKILENIKPDYGSLGEFMKNVAISKDIVLHNRKYPAFDIGRKTNSRMTLNRKRSDLC
jgi:hypothetical protein